jgi:phage terminase small subunit
MPHKKPDLTTKEAIFVREYLRDGNGARAYKAAGYSAKSDNAAAVGASKLLRKAKVQEELALLRAKLCTELEISAKKVLQGIAQLAFFDPRKFFHAEDVKNEKGEVVIHAGALKAVYELDDATAMALQGMNVEKLFKHFGKGQAEEIGTISKIKFADRSVNLELLGRHLKLFTDKVQITDPAGIVARLRAGRERVAKA